MFRYACVATIASLLIAFQANGEALSKSKIVHYGKSAAALVEVGADGFATAFCVHARGLFVTNAHVVDAAKGGPIVLILNPGSKDQTKYRATVVRTDKASDLSLLRTESPGDFAALEVDERKEIEELTDVYAFGFPFGKEVPGANGYPSISVNQGMITSLRMKDSELHRIQLDAALNPGNSGGPLLGENGKVLGVVQSGVIGTGVNLAIPNIQLRRFLSKPVVHVEEPTITQENKHEPVPFAAQIIELANDGERPDYLVELVLETGHQSRRVKMKLQDGVHHAEAVVFPKDAGPRRLATQVRFTNGEIEGSVANEDIKIDDEVIPLEMIQEMTAGTEPRVLLRSGRVLLPQSLAIPQLTIMLGGNLLNLQDTSQVRRARFEPWPQSSVTDYRVTASLDGKETTQTSGILAFNNSADNASIRITQPKLDEEEVTLDLRSEVSDIVAGAGGRYLFLQLSSSNQVAVFDVSEGRITRHLPIPSSAHIVAGARQLLAFVSPENIVRTWTLPSFAEEPARVLDIQGQLKSVALGHSSEGPLLTHWAVDTGALSNSTFSFLDLETLEPISIQMTNRANGILHPMTGGHALRLNNTSYRDHVQMRASGDGRVYGLWCTSHSPSGLETLVLNGRSLLHCFEHNTVGFVSPTSDGSQICTARGIYSPDLTSKVEEAAILPSYQPSLCLKLSALELAQPRRATASPAPKFYIADATTGSTLASLPPLPEMVGIDQDNWTQARLTIDKRIHFLPQANLLVTVPKGQLKLFVRRVDWKSMLEAAEAPYLLITSTPPSRARIGDRLVYPLQVESDSAVVGYRVVKGPNDMAVSDSGTLVWNASGKVGEEVPCIIEVTNEQGGKSFHRFALTLVD